MCENFKINLFKTDGVSFLHLHHFIIKSTRASIIVVQNIFLVLKPMLKVKQLVYYYRETTFIR